MTCSVNLVVGEIPVVDLVRKRGDTKSIDLTIVDEDDVAIDISAYSFTLAVNKLKEPLDAADELFQSAGSIVDGPNGRVSFPITVGNADNVGEYFYDIEYTDGASEILTFVEGSFKMNQDRGK